MTKIRKTSAIRSLEALGQQPTARIFLLLVLQLNELLQMSLPLRTLMAASQYYLLLHRPVLLVPSPFCYYVKPPTVPSEVPLEVLAA